MGRGALRERLFRPIRLALPMLKYNLTCDFLSHPYPLRIVFALIRRLDLSGVSPIGTECAALP